MQVVLVYVISSRLISTQFTLEMCTAVENCKKTLKPLFWEFKVI